MQIEARRWDEDVRADDAIALMNRIQTHAFLVDFSTPQAILLARDRWNKTLLHLACNYNALDCLNAIMRALDDLPPENTRDFLNERDTEGNTAVCTSFLCENVRAVSRLVQSGSSYLLEASNVVGDICFHIATRRGDKSAADMLLGLPTRTVIDAKNDHGDTSLHIAVRDNYNCIAESLVHAGAQKTTNNNLGLTPLDIARIHDRDGYNELLENHVG